MPGTAPQEIGRWTSYRLIYAAVQDPRVADTMAPRLSWELQSDRRCRMQSGYQALVASDPSLLLAGKVDLWDSGMFIPSRTYTWKMPVSRCKSVSAVFGKGRLGSRRRFGPYSEVARWEMGLLDEGDWSAQWIGAPQFPPRRLKASAGAVIEKTFRFSRI